MLQENSLWSCMEKLPYSLDAEKSIIYSILAENEKLNEVSVELTEADFHFQENRTIIKVIKQLYELGRTIDAITIEDYLDSNENLRKQVSENYVMEILDTIASPNNIHTYIEIVSQKSKLRRLIITMKSMMEEAINIPDDADLFMDKVQQSIFDLSMKRAK